MFIRCVHFNSYCLWLFILSWLNMLHDDGVWIFDLWRRYDFSLFYWCFILIKCYVFRRNQLRARLPLINSWCFTIVLYLLWSTLLVLFQRLHPQRLWFIRKCIFLIWRNLWINPIMIFYSSFILFVNAVRFFRWWFNTIRVDLDWPA